LWVLKRRIRIIALQIDGFVLCNLFLIEAYIMLAHLAEGHESLWDGAASVRPSVSQSVARPASTFSL